MTKGIEEIKNRKQEEVSEKREERVKQRERELETERMRQDEQERDAANGAANDFDMDANNMSGTGAEDRQSPDAEPMGGMDMDKDFGYNAGKFGSCQQELLLICLPLVRLFFFVRAAQLLPPQALDQSGDAPPVYQALPSANNHHTSASRVPSPDENATTNSANRSSSRIISSSSASTSTVQASGNSTAQISNKENVLPPSTLSASLAAALAGQKRSAKEVEGEASQEGTNKRSKLAEGEFMPWCSLSFVKLTFSKQRTRRKVPNSTPQSASSPPLLLLSRPCHLNQLLLRPPLMVRSPHPSTSCHNRRSRRFVLY